GRKLGDGTALHAGDVGRHRRDGGVHFRVALLLDGVGPSAHRLGAFGGPAVLGGTGDERVPPLRPRALRVLQQVAQVLGAATGAYLVEQRPLHAVVAGEPGVFDGLIEALVEFGRGLADLPLGCVGDAQQVDPFGGEGYAGDAAVGIDFGGGAVIGLGQAEPHHDPLR